MFSIWIQDLFQVLLHKGSAARCWNSRFKGYTYFDNNNFWVLPIFRLSILSIALVFIAQFFANLRKLSELTVCCNLVRFVYPSFRDFWYWSFQGVRVSLHCWDIIYYLDVDLHFVKVNHILIMVEKQYKIVTYKYLCVILGFIFWSIHVG